MFLYSCDPSGKVVVDDSNRATQTDSETTPVFASAEGLFEFLIDYSADLEITEEEILEGQLSFNAESGEVTLLSLEQKEPDFFIIPGMIEGETAQPFQVSCCCDTEGKEFIETYCDGTASCGVLLTDCLQRFACESTCTAKLYFHPKTGFIGMEYSAASAE